MSGVRHIEVKSADEGARLDRWFKTHVPEIGFSQLQKLMRKGAIRLDGKRVKGKERLEPGQIVRVPPVVDNGGGDRPREARKPKLDENTIKEVRSWVIYKDESVIVINKPAGLPTQGGTGVTRHLDGLLDALTYDSSARPKLVHRLDKDTSGALLLARTTGAAAFLAKHFQTKTTDKRYWAVVVGAPKIKDGRISVRMDKVGGKGHEKMAVSGDGKLSLTDYEVISHVHKTAAWMALKPHTGRTHQLRLHCSEIGHPIVGDGKYGGQDAMLGGLISKKLHLHSRFVTFQHPDGGKRTVTAPLPPHMVATFDNFGFDENDYEDPFLEDRS